MADYQYVTTLNRYRNVQTGRFVSRATIMGYVEQITAHGQTASDDLARLVAEGQISPRDFGIGMREALRTTYIQDAVLGRGGRGQMDPSDWGSVGRRLREQYRLLDGFVADIESGTLSEAQISSRARLYFQGARAAYEQANARAHGVPRGALPSWPGDSNQTCESGCQCGWRFEKVFDADGNLVEIHAYWELTPGAEHCEPEDGKRGCVQNAAEYNPLVIAIL